MTAVPAQQVAAVRRFNRFYTRQLGLLRSRFFESRFSLSEARVLYEIAHREKCTASDIVAELDIDHGYLSRILTRFAADGLISKKRVQNDARQTLLSLTAKGRKVFAPLNRRSDIIVETMLQGVSGSERERVVAAMNAIESIVGKKNVAHEEVRPAYTLRTHRSGDMGWVVERHATLYGVEYGWDARIEALTAEIVAAFLKNFDPARERCWIAEIAGEPVGSVFLVKETDDVARLRLLIVDPKARGLGIGKRLVDECVTFARQAGYAKITLWTHVVLVSARRIYKGTGFRVVEEWVHDEFGKPEASESWDLIL